MLNTNVLYHKQHNDNLTLVLDTVTNRNVGKGRGRIEKKKQRKQRGLKYCSKIHEMVQEPNQVSSCATRV